MYLIVYNDFAFQHIIIHEYVGPAPITFEWSTSLLSTKVPNIRGLTVFGPGLYDIWMAGGGYWCHNWSQCALLYMFVRERTKIDIYLGVYFLHVILTIGHVANVYIFVFPKNNSTRQLLTHWGRRFPDNTSKRISWMIMLEFRLRCHWSLFPRAKLTIIQHWLR